MASSFSFGDAELFNAGGLSMRSSLSSKLMDCGKSSNLGCATSDKSDPEGPVKMPSATNDGSLVVKKGGVFVPQKVPAYRDETGASFMDDLDDLLDLDRDAVDTQHKDANDDANLLHVDSLDSVVEEPEQEVVDTRKQTLLKLSGALLTAFGDETFQSRLKKSMKAEYKRQRKAEGAPLAHVEGRKDLVMEVQRRILPEYGFAGSKIGIYSMLLAFEPYRKDEDVLDKMSAMDEALGLPPATSLRDIDNVVAIMKPSF